ncbi:MAG: tyrosine-type recombinase/integrase [Chloroflexi bacterium]|nr:tyrosine-type recombinase/integrase [Chloroflexota bacterium]
MAYRRTTDVPATEPERVETVNDAAEWMLRGLELTSRTRRTYRHGTTAFLRFLHIAHGRPRDAERPAAAPLSWIDEETLSAFAGWLRGRYPDPRAGAGGSSRTARNYLVAAKRVMNWLDLRGLLPAGVSYDRMVRRVDAGRGHRRQSYVQRPTDPDVYRVVTHYLRQSLPQGPIARLTLLRNRALVAVLWDTAMRVSEALALTRADVLDGRAEKVRLSITKNGKPRTVFLGAAARRVLRAYCAARDDSLLAPLFVAHGRGREAGAITPQTAWLVVKRAALAEGLYKNTSPHSLRHGRAQQLLDQGMRIEYVQALLGHESVSTTRVVYAYQSDEEALGQMVRRYGRWPDDPAEGEGADDGAADGGAAESKEE